MEKVIKLKNNDKQVLKFPIYTEDGENTGKYLKFDMGDIGLILKLNDAFKKHQQNLRYIRDQYVIINKREDKKGKYILSYNEEEKAKVLNEFYRKDMEAINCFLGKNGCETLLEAMDREPYWDMFEDILGDDGMIAPILPELKLGLDDVANKVKEKYGKKEEENILE